MKKTLCTFLLLFFTTTLMTISFLKSKKVVKRQSPAQLKENIGYELEDILTLSSDLIASLSKVQKIIVSKMHTLVAPEKEDFFSNVKANELEKYLHNLKEMHQELKDIEQKIKIECTHFSKNFIH